MDPPSTRAQPAALDEPHEVPHHGRAGMVGVETIGIGVLEDHQVAGVGDRRDPDAGPKQEVLDHRKARTGRMAARVLGQPNDAFLVAGQDLDPAVVPEVGVHFPVRRRVLKDKHQSSALPLSSASRSAWAATHSE